MDVNIIDNDSIQIDVNSEFETNPIINTINYELKHKFNDKELLTSKGNFCFQKPTCKASPKVFLHGATQI